MRLPCRLRGVVTAGLIAANAEQFRTISMPLMRTGDALGRYERSKEEALAELAIGISAYTMLCPKSVVERIFIVVYDDPESEKTLRMLLADRHPLSVRGFPGTLDELAIAIGSLRYDCLERLFCALGKEFDRQNRGDHERGRIKLASLLGEAAGATENLREIFARIWRLCRPHM